MNSLKTEMPTVCRSSVRLKVKMGTDPAGRETVDKEAKAPRAAEKQTNQQEKAGLSRGNGQFRQDSGGSGGRALFP